MEKKLLTKNEYQKQYRVVGIVIFAVAVGALLLRILSYFISGLFSGLEDYISELVLDSIFTILMQVLLLFVMPFLVYKLALKKSAKEVFRFSNFRKTKPVNLLFGLMLGILGIIVTIGISFAWQIFLIIFGYIPPDSSTAFPETFNIWLFLASLFLTAVLPGFCEEFTMRGGFLTAMRSAFPLVTVILISALSFGLFHQFILQTFYTACFGGLMAYITIRSKSIFPAMILHFTNNGISVYLDYAEKYNWVGGGFFENINNMMINGQTTTLLGVYVLIFAAFCMLIYLFSKINPKDVTYPVMLDGSKASDTLMNPRSNLDGFTVQKAPPLEVDLKIVPRRFVEAAYGRALSSSKEGNTAEERILFINKRYYLISNGMLYALKQKVQFKPSWKDNMFYIGAIVISVLSTIFTLIWGYII